MQKVTQARRKGEKKVKSSKEEGSMFYLFIFFFFLSYFSKNEICARNPPHDDPCVSGI